MAVSNGNNNNGNHSTRRLIISAAVSALAGLVVALVVFYIGFGQNAVSRTEIRALINEYSPYAQDKETIRRELDDLHDSLHRLDSAMRTHQLSDTAIMSRLEAKVDDLRIDVNRLLNKAVRVTPKPAQTTPVRITPRPSPSQPISYKPKPKPVPTPAPLPAPTPVPTPKPSVPVPPTASAPQQDRSGPGVVIGGKPKPPPKRTTPIAPSPTPPIASCPPNPKMGIICKAP